MRQRARSQLRRHHLQQRGRSPADLRHRACRRVGRTPERVAAPVLGMPAMRRARRCASVIANQCAEEFTPPFASPPNCIGECARQGGGACVAGPFGGCQCAPVAPPCGTAGAHRSATASATATRPYGRGRHVHLRLAGLRRGRGRAGVLGRDASSASAKRPALAAEPKTRRDLPPLIRVPEQHVRSVPVLHRSRRRVSLSHARCRRCSRIPRGSGGALQSFVARKPWLVGPPRIACKTPPSEGPLRGSRLRRHRRFNGATRRE